MSQRTISMQSLLRWIEKISANANTPQLDSIELNALSKHLNFLMDSKETSMSVVTVPSTGLVLSDNLSGVVVLNVPVTLVEGTGLVIPAITKAAEFGGKVTFLIKFVLDETVETFTVYNVLALFQEIQTSIFGTLLTLSKEEKDFLNYLDTITGQAWAEDDVLVFGVDFTTLLTLIDYIKADGLYEARTLNISVPELDLGSTVVNVAKTGTVTLTGTHLVNNVALMLSGGFTADADVIARATVMAEGGVVVTISYTNAAAGTYKGNLLVSSGEITKMIPLTVTVTAE